MVNKLLLLSVLFSSTALATNLLSQKSEDSPLNLHDISPNHPVWNATTTYTAGDVVKHQQQLYIATFWARGVEPLANQPHWDGWIWVQNSVVDKWHADKVYQAGHIVKHGTDYYFSRYWSKNNEPKNHSSWQPIKELFYKTPNLPAEHPDDYTTLDGVDQNNNGIRDDYERYVYEKFDAPALITFSLGAASTLQTLIDIEQDRVPNLDAEIGKQVILDMVNIHFCTRKLQTTYNHYRNPKSIFFNTLDRSYANRKSQNKISDLIPWGDEYYYEADQDCLFLNNEVSK